MPESQESSAATLLWRSNQTPHSFRPIDLARRAGLSASQVRQYERFGFLPPAERSVTGYRRYTARHVTAMSVARTAICGYGFEPALEVMRAAHAGDTATAWALVNASHAALDREREHIDRALTALDDALRPEPEQANRRTRAHSLHIAAAAQTVGVRPSALRYWEQRGLLDPAREAGTGYRVYDRAQLRRLAMVALLRRVDYDFETIRAVVDDLAVGRPEHARRALERRRVSVHRSSQLRVRATAALYAYVTDTATNAGADASTDRGTDADSAP